MRKEEVLSFLERLRDQASVPIVYVSHVLSEIERLSGRVVLMSDGHVPDLDPASKRSTVIWHSGRATRADECLL